MSADRSSVLRVSLWRLLVATSGGTGVLLAALQYAVWWTALSQLASIVVGVVYLALAVGPLLTGRPAPDTTWLRGALATLMALVSLAFLAMQHGNVLDHYSVFEHLLTPALVIADFLLVGTRQRRPRWWHPLTWTLVPLPYLAWYVVADLGVYAALDPSRPVAFVIDVGLLLALVLGAGFALVAATRLTSPGAPLLLLAPSEA